MVDRRVAKLIADMEQADRVHGEAKARKAAENRANSNSWVPGNRPSRTVRR